MFLSCLLKSITICGWILSTDLCLHSKLLIYFRKKAKEKFTATHAHRNSSNRLLPLFCLCKKTLYCKMSILWDYSFIKAFHIVFHRIVDVVPHLLHRRWAGKVSILRQYSFKIPKHFLSINQSNSPERLFKSIFDLGAWVLLDDLSGAFFV